MRSHLFLRTTGAIRPSSVLTMSTKMPAMAGEYQPADLNGLSGIAKPHAANPAVAANISHTGQAAGLRGTSLPDARRFPA